MFSLLVAHQVIGIEQLQGAASAVHLERSPRKSSAIFRPGEKSRVERHSTVDRTMRQKRVDKKGKRSTK
jgi:hypothetical protein